MARRVVVAIESARADHEQAFLSAETRQRPRRKWQLAFHGQTKMMRVTTEG
jgi:hypothetical protein